MNGEKLITIIVIVFGGAILLAAGYFIGIGYAGKKQESVLDSKNFQGTANVKITNSKIIKNISASGKITALDIPNRTITIADGEESMNIYIKEGAQITSFILVASSKGEPVSYTNSKQIKAGFSDIKIGDQASVTIKILADNKIETDSLIIIPAQISSNK